MKPVRVAIVWPGTDGVAAGNFGLPQLCTMATYVRDRTGANVDIIDLSCERARGAIDLRRLAQDDEGNAYDVVGFSCYSSFDYLKIMAIAETIRPLVPDAVFVSGGYHTSSRPTDFVFDGSPFDVAVIGEGERPLAEVVASVQGGAPLRQKILGPLAIDDLDTLPVTDWSFLARYKGVARRVASQAEVYLSRGCPFDCAFCMERAKREVSWRAYGVDRAIAEIENLDAFLDLSGFSVYIADALFGMKRAWRREFLEQFARRKPDALSYWLLIRVDMVEREDLELFSKCNMGLGFGLESGDPAQLARIRKAGKLDEYLDRMVEVAAFARERNVPWGANVIFGHPGETEASLRTSAAYLRKLFLDPKGTTGFLSVDPFRLYPGSPIDDDRRHWETTYGTRFHRNEWWKDGDQEFLSEWVDPSADLSYRRYHALVSELVDPILQELPAHFCFQGDARHYYMRALEDQIDHTAATYRRHFVDRYYAWNRYLGRRAVPFEERRTDSELIALCKDARAAAMEGVAAYVTAALGDEAGATFAASAVRDALIEVPRECFVPLDAINASTRDEAIALDEEAHATVSAMHAYAIAYTLAQVKPGDRVLDLGAGSGYGTALLARLVGERGFVRSVEVDPGLVTLARYELGGRSNVDLREGDGLAPTMWEGAGFDAVVVGFAVETRSALHALAERGAVVVAPVVADDGEQHLARLRKVGDRVEVETFHAVYYVPERRYVAQVPAPVLPPASEATREPARRLLPLVR